MGFDRRWYGERAHPHSSGCEGTGATEFSWGAGQVAPGKERATPADGGAYRGRTPSAEERRRKPRRGEARGHPGQRIAW